jgi:hypothetical protein
MVVRDVTIDDVIEWKKSERVTPDPRGPIPTLRDDICYFFSYKEQKWKRV